MKYYIIIRGNSWDDTMNHKFCYNGRDWTRRDKVDRGFSNLGLRIVLRDKNDNKR